MNLKIRLKDPKYCEGCPCLQSVNIEEEKQLDVDSRTQGVSLEEYYRGFYTRVKDDYCWCRYYTAAISPFHTKDITGREYRFILDRKGEKSLFSPLRPDICLKGVLHPISPDTAKWAGK